LPAVPPLIIPLFFAVISLLFSLFLEAGKSKNNIDFNKLWNVRQKRWSDRRKRGLKVSRIESLATECR
jgi:hypothetical protein